MSDPITIAGVEDFAAVLRLARGELDRAIVGAAAGCDARTLRRHEGGEACNPRTLIDLLSACGYHMEVRLVPAHTAGAARVAAAPAHAVSTHHRALAYVGSHPGTGSQALADHLRVTRQHAHRLMREAIRAGEVWTMAGRHGNTPWRYWRADPSPE
jgi:hypothetical protein